MSRIQQGEYYIGQTLPYGLPRLSTGDGNHWYGLIAGPQKEIRAQNWLKQRGVYSFFPVREYKTKIRGKTYQRQKRYLPGYLFAEIPGEPIWHNVFDSPFIANAIRLRLTSEPARLSEASLSRILDMAGVEQQMEREARQRRTLRRKDRARIRNGAFEGHVVEVLEIGSGTAKVTLELLGKGEVAVDLSSLEKVE